MWWLQRVDLANRTYATAAKLGTYPDTSITWVRDGVRDPRRPSTPSRRYRRRTTKHPESIPAGILFKGLQKIKRQKLQGGFPIPPSWKIITPKSYEQKEAISKPPIEQDFRGKKPSRKERLRILKEQEEFVPISEHSRKIFCPKTNPRKSSKEERQSSEWICRSLAIKPPIGRLDGCRWLFSSIGKKLILKSRALKLWHEEASQADGRPAKTIILGSIIPASRTVSADRTVWYKPICQLMRVTVPFNLRTSPRITPEEQRNDIEKGGHMSARKALHDYKIRVQALRRQKGNFLEREEARLLLCEGILNDNAQEYAKALESYQGYLDLCKKFGDKQGEARAYNFIGCSIQEDQDLKLAKEQRKAPKGEFQIPTAAVIQYEKAEEYHKMHINIANLEGKFIAYTNLGLLYATVGKPKEAAISHQKALNYATLLESPENQGVAVGNLGFLLFCQREWGIANICMIKYLQICMAFKDLKGLIRARYILGSIALQYNRHDEALKEFKTALMTAQLVKDHQMETLTKIMIGIAKGDAMHDKQI